jgi:long-chain acyl-CoA synthetase
MNAIELERPAGDEAALQRNLVEILLDRAKREAARPWMIQPVNGVDRVWNYGEAAGEIRRIAAWLCAQGLPPGSRICISGRNTAHWHMADLAIAMAGHVGVGLYPKQGKRNVEYIFAHAEAKILFVGPSLMAGDANELMTAVPAEVLTVGFPYEGVPKTTLQWNDLVAETPPLQDYAPPPDDAVAMLVYTSGTSGNPKGVMITQGNLKFVIGRVLRNTPFPQSQERLFSYLPLAHLMERLMGEAVGLAMGAETHFLERVEDLAATLARVAPTRFAGVPLVYSRIQSGLLGKLPQRKLDFILGLPIIGKLFRQTLLKKMGLHRAVVCGSGGAPMPVPMIEWFSRLGIEIYQGYGMTENCAYAAVGLPGANRIGSVGKPMPDCGLRIADDGELQFRHGGVMAGYFKDEQQTRQAFTEDGWLRSGDRGRLDADGYLYVTGRIKDIFKTGKGKYVAPVPIEGALARNTDLDQLCLVGAGLNQPIMLVTLNANGQSRPREQLGATLLANMEAVNQTLEDHEKIAKCIVVAETWTPDNGLLTPTAKVRRNDVEARYAELIRVEAASREPKIVWAQG